MVYDEFVEIVGQLLNFLTPEQLAEDLKVSSTDVLNWECRKNLPKKEEKRRLYHLMERHEIWDTMF